MFMDGTNTAGANSSDWVEFDWFYDSAPHRFIGGMANIARDLLGDPVAGTDSMMFPGMIFRVRTGPDTATGGPGVPASADHESYGFQMASIEFSSLRRALYASRSRWHPNCASAGVRQLVADRLR